MKSKLATGLLLLGLSAGIAAPVFAADETAVYGGQLMTKQERQEFRERMRNAKTVEEREQIRKEHHEEMRKRAADMGVELPEEPPARGMGGGMGPGGGMGGGMGKGK